MDTIEIKKIIEAALLASTQPLTVPHLEALFADNSDTPVSHELVAGALEALGEDCAERGIELVEVASGFRFQIRQEVHPWVQRMWTERPSRYSRALLETLALIAYRQPITRGEIEQVRGVTVSTNIVKTLEEREWIRVVGHRDAPGRPALFGTTRTFLDYFNLKSLDELPPLADILNLEDMDPQLKLDGDKTAQVGPPAPADSDAGSGHADPEHAAPDEAVETPPETAATDSLASGATDDAESTPLETENAVDTTPSRDTDADDGMPDVESPADAGHEKPEEDRA